jgi:hypothetical protein
VNASEQMKTGEVKEQWYPSGTYKSLIKVSDDSDENIFTIVLRIEHHLHSEHDLEF